MKKRTAVILFVNGLILVVIGLVCIAPFLSVMVAGTIADRFGCTLHEGFVNPCVINGVDYGETLYSMGVMGWLFFLSVPLAVGLLAVYIVVWLVILMVKGIRRRRNSLRAAAL